MLFRDFKVKALGFGNLLSEFVETGVDAFRQLAVSAPLFDDGREVLHATYAVELVLHRRAFVGPDARLNLLHERLALTRVRIGVVEYLFGVFGGGLSLFVEVAGVVGALVVRMGVAQLVVVVVDVRVQFELVYLLHLECLLVQVTHVVVVF